MISENLLSTIKIINNLREDLKDIVNFNNKLEFHFSVNDEDYVLKIMFNWDTKEFSLKEINKRPLFGYLEIIGFFKNVKLLKEELIEWKKRFYYRLEK